MHYDLLASVLLCFTGALLLAAAVAIVAAPVCDDDALNMEDIEHAT